MGCHSSKLTAEEHDTVLQPLAITAPQGGLIMIPPTRRDEHGIPIQPQQYDLTRYALQRALAYVATYLHQHNVNLTIVAVGGAVNTILLRSRDVTHDVDFINPSVPREQMHLLHQASAAALAQISVELGEEWLNNTTTLLVPSKVQIEPGDEAAAQGEIVFQQSVLTVLAAPWRYALCTKLERMGKPTR
ncbi:MAG: hypothetical protein Q9213_002741 [Squamulea squamosa]